MTIQSIDTTDITVQRRTPSIRDQHTAAYEDGRDFDPTDPRSLDVVRAHEAERAGELPPEPDGGLFDLDPWQGRSKKGSPSAFH